MAAAVSIGVLGPLTVRRDGEVVSVGGPRPQALLIRLVVARELLATDRLVEDLWAGDPPRSAVNTLQTYVSTLRRALGDADQSLVIREGPGYRVDLAALDVDAERFRRLIDTARGRSDPADRLRDLDDALALWSGPALLDVADTEWARPVAHGLDEARLAAVEDRFDALLELGDHGRAAAELPEVLADHPLRERLAAQLVLALYRSGRQAEALRAYDRTRELLVEELGVGPGPELTRLHLAVLDQDPELAAPVASVAPATPDPRGPALGAPDAGRPPIDLAPTSTRPATLPAGAARYERRPMVGRAAELAELRARWADSGTGAGLVLVTGEPGIGKTRLAASFAGAVHDEGGTVLWGSCPREPLGPFQPFAGALREHLGALPGREAARLLDGLGPLGALVPQLVADHDGSTDLGLDRFRLFEAVATALSLFAGDGGAVLVVDDLHWADPDTCSLLGHVLRHATLPGLLVVATVRSHDVEPNPALVELVADLQRDRLVTRLPLGGLPTAAIGELAGASDEDGGAGIDATELRRATGGNPYFVEELLAALREEPDRPGAAPPVPASVRDVLQARFARLGDPVVSVLEVAALVGAEFDLAIVERAGDVEDDDLLDRVDRAVDAGLLVESPRVLGRYSFAHELVRQALADRHGATRRARLHLRIAEALGATEATGGVIDTADVPAAIAHHRLAALPLGDLGAALDAAVKATRDGVERLAFADACATAELALATIERTGAVVPSAGRAELLLELGRAKRAAGDLAAAVGVFTEAVAHARDASRADLEADAVLGAIGPRPTGTRLDYEPADPALLAMAEHALEALAGDPARRAALLAGRAWLQPRSGPVDARLAAIDEALDLARACGDDALQARVLLARHSILLGPDHLDERIEAVQAAVARAVAAGADEIELHARVAAASDLLERGDVAAVRTEVARMAELADRLGQPAYRFHPGTFGILLSLLEGDHAAAEAQAYAMYEATKELRTEVAGEIALVSRLYQVARDRGRMAELFPLLAQQLAGSRQVFLNAAYALAAAEVGEVAEAREQLALVLGDDADLDADRDHVPREALWSATTAVAAETAAMLGDARAGAVLARRLEPFGGRLVVVGTMYTLGSVDRYVGLSHLVAGDLDAADRWLASGIELDRRVGAQAFLARGLADRSLALRRRDGAGDAALAAALADESRALADELGLGPAWSLHPGAADPSS
jgi:DNA-binding SARP family transcriptional activator